MEKPQGSGLLSTLMQQMEGTAAQRLSLFEKLKRAGMLACDDPVELKVTEDMLRTLAATEKMEG